MVTGIQMMGSMNEGESMFIITPTVIKVADPAANKSLEAGDGHEKDRCSFPGAAGRTVFFDGCHGIPLNGLCVPLALCTAERTSAAPPEASCSQGTGQGDYDAALFVP
jgi:hypothetical protein